MTYLVLIKYKIGYKLIMLISFPTPIQSSYPIHPYPILFTKQALCYLKPKNEYTKKVFDFVIFLYAVSPIKLWLKFWPIILNLFWATWLVENRVASFLAALRWTTLLPSKRSLTLLIKMPTLLGCFLKKDIEKAYDSLNWNGIPATLAK